MSPLSGVNRHNGATATTLSRSPLSAGLAVEEFDARDWRKDELRTLARTAPHPQLGQEAGVGGACTDEVDRKRHSDR